MPFHSPTLASPLQQDGGGTIGYGEMEATLKRTTDKKKAKKAKEMSEIPPVPELPRDLNPRKRDIQRLHEQFNNKEGKMASVDTFEAALKLYYPKDGKETINIMARWVIEMDKLKEAQEKVRTREADIALIEALDEDGNGKISIREFCELSKASGLSKAQMRAKFREKDLGNSGELTKEQTGELLQEMREEIVRQKEKEAQAQAIFGEGFGVVKKKKGGGAHGEEAANATGLGSVAHGAKVGGAAKLAGFG